MTKIDLATFTNQNGDIELQKLFLKNKELKILKLQSLEDFTGKCLRYLNPNIEKIYLELDFQEFNFHYFIKYIPSFV